MKCLLCDIPHILDNMKRELRVPGGKELPGETAADTVGQGDVHFRGPSGSPLDQPDYCSTKQTAAK